MTESWNRQELYNEIWEQPMVKLSLKYGISAVMLGKVCRKLRIPVPGRGYWARKEAGKHVSRHPLPNPKGLPIVRRMKSRNTEPPKEQPPEPEPSDPEYIQIKDLESRPLAVRPHAHRHPLIITTEKAFRGSEAGTRGRISSNWDPAALNLTVSRAALGRALRILNAVVIALEKFGFPVLIGKESRAPFTKIFGQDIHFEIVEKYRQFRIPESDRKSSYSYPTMRYEPNGILEFRGGGAFSELTLRDSAKHRLEDQLSQMIGMLMRAARSEGIWAEERRQEEVKRRERETERSKLAKEIEAEEKRIADLDSWVSRWIRAKQYREFIETLEMVWAEAGHDLAPEAEKGKRIIWMKQQADRLDPFIEGPPSILDRKHELSWH